MLRRRQNNPIAGLIVGVVFLCIGGAMTPFGVRNVLQAQQSQNWPTTTGEVISSAVEVNSDSDGDTYRAAVIYTYIAADKNRQSSQVFIGDDIYTSARRIVDQTVARYPVGSRVTVYYNPEDPDVAVLETGVRLNSTLFLLMGVGFGLIGLFSLGASAFALINPFG